MLLWEWWEGKGWQKPPSPVGGQSLAQAEPLGAVSVAFPSL